MFLSSRFGQIFCYQWLVSLYFSPVDAVFLLKYNNQTKLQNPFLMYYCKLFHLHLLTHSSIRNGSAWIKYALWCIKWVCCYLKTGRIAVNRINTNINNQIKDASSITVLKWPCFTNAAGLVVVVYELMLFRYYALIESCLQWHILAVIQLMLALHLPLSPW